MADKDEPEGMPYGAVRSPGEEESVAATEDAAKRDRNKPAAPFLSPGEIDPHQADETAEKPKEKDGED